MASMGLPLASTPPPRRRRPDGWGPRRRRRNTRRIATYHTSAAALVSPPLSLNASTDHFILSFVMGMTRRNALNVASAMSPYVLFQGEIFDGLAGREFWWGGGLAGRERGRCVVGH